MKGKNGTQPWVGNTGPVFPPVHSQAGINGPEGSASNPKKLCKENRALKNVCEDFVDFKVPFGAIQGGARSDLT